MENKLLDVANLDPDACVCVWSPMEWPHLTRRARPMSMGSDGAGQRRCDSCNTGTFLLEFSIMSTESPRAGMKRSLIVEHVLHFASSQRKMSPQAFT